MISLPNFIENEKKFGLRAPVENVSEHLGLLQMVKFTGAYIYKYMYLLGGVCQFIILFFFNFLSCLFVWLVLRNLKFPGEE